MDEQIREALRHKAQGVDVPIGAWDQIHKAIRFSPPVGLWHRHRLRAWPELVAVACVFLLLGVIGALRQGLNSQIHGGTSTAPSLVVVEHLVAPSSEVGSDLLKLRRQPTDSLRDINSRDTAAQLTKDNDLLKSFSYRVEQTQDGSYSIYHGDQLVIAGITKISSVSVSERQDDFIFMAWIPADRYWLVQSSGAKEWIEADVIRHRFQPPVYVHDDLVSVEWDERSGTYILTQNGQRVFTVPLKSTVSGDEIKRLTSWSGHWVLEVEGDVYIDGVSLSKQMGYDEVFEWRLLDGHPFYLFSKDSQFGVVYRDKVQEYKYDEVPHNLCCEPASLNPSGDGVMVWFYGLRSGNWYLVETTTRP